MSSLTLILTRGAQSFSCNCNLKLNVSETKELLVDFGRKQQRNYHPVRINKAQIERPDSLKYLIFFITQDLPWSCHINTLVKKPCYHLRCPKGFKIFLLLRNFYICSIESILSVSITTWMGTAPKRTIWPLRGLSGQLSKPSEPPSLTCRIFTTGVADQRPRRFLVSQATQKTPLLPSGRCYRCLKGNTEMMRRSFFPQAIRLLNKNFD